MYSLNEKRFVRDLEELLRTQNKLNIAIVGNISAGKSLFEDIFCQRLGDNVECLSRTAEERTGMVREVDNYERNIMWLIKMMNSVTANSVLPQEKITRISKQTLDSI